MRPWILASLLVIPSVALGSDRLQGQLHQRGSRLFVSTARSLVQLVGEDETSQSLLRQLLAFGSRGVVLRGRFVANQDPLSRRYRCFVPERIQSPTRTTVQGVVLRDRRGVRPERGRVVLRLAGDSLQPFGPASQVLEAVVGQQVVVRGWRFPYPTRRSVPDDDGGPGLVQRDDLLVDGLRELGGGGWFVRDREGWWLERSEIRRRVSAPTGHTRQVGRVCALRGRVVWDRTLWRYVLRTSDGPITLERDPNDLLAFPSLELLFGREVELHGLLVTAPGQVVPTLRVDRAISPVHGVVKGQLAADRRTLLTLSGRSLPLMWEEDEVLEARLADRAGKDVLLYGWLFSDEAGEPTQFFVRRLTAWDRSAPRIGLRDVLEHMLRSPRRRQR